MVGGLIGYEVCSVGWHMAYQMGKLVEGQGVRGMEGGSTGSEGLSVTGTVNGSSR